MKNKKLYPVGTLLFIPGDLNASDYTFNVSCGVITGHLFSGNGKISAYRTYWTDYHKIIEFTQEQLEAVILGTKTVYQENGLSHEL